MKSYQKKVERILYALKHDAHCDIPAELTVPLHNGKKLRLYVVTKNLIERDDVISTLAEWRDKANIWFPSQFPVTIEGTKKWAREQLLNKSDRILFFVEIAGGNDGPFAHVGLYRFDYENRTCEIDNIIRGKNIQATKGGVTIALQAMIDWAFTNLGFTALYLQVFSDNKRAIALYKRLGFGEDNRVPLIKKVDSKVISWIEPKPGKNIEQITRYFVRMKLSSSSG